MKNPLLSDFIIPNFSSIKEEHMLPAIIYTVNKCKKKINEILKINKLYSWNNFCQVILEENDHIQKIFSLISHLYFVNSNTALREIYQQTLLILTEYHNWSIENKNLFFAYKNLKDNCYNKCNIFQKKHIKNTIRDFLLSGINLEKYKKQKHAKILSKLSVLSALYDNNVVDSTKAWKKVITNEKELKGLSKNFLKNLENFQKNKEWIIHLETAHYMQIIMYCKNQSLRKEIYYAYNTKASDQGPHAGKWDNTSIISEILSLRYESANLLGFNSYAEYALKKTMAKNPLTVINFINTLIKNVKKKAMQEIAKLKNFSKKNYGIKKLYPWDIAYYSEKQKTSLYFVDDEKIRAYFPLQQVLKGLFTIVKKIYNINIQETETDVWDKNVKFFNVFEGNNKKLKGSFYLDLYIRNNKRDGAWMHDCITMIKKNNTFIQKPIAYLNCNFPNPYNNKISLLNHHEISTLFHEFGHVLHHIMTIVDVPSISGIHGIPWDCIEIPSQLMEKWCWEEEVLRLISCHYKTQKPLPKKIINKIILSKNYQSALFILRQLELSLFDLHLHYEYHPNINNDVLLILKKIKKEFSIFPMYSWNRFANSFSHIFSGGYAANYYSYMWSETMAIDIYSRFQKEGIFNCETGKSFLNNILSLGGSEHPMILFSKFQGREPEMNIILKYYKI